MALGVSPVLEENVTGCLSRRGRRGGSRQVAAQSPSAPRSWGRPTSEPPAHPPHPCRSSRSAWPAGGPRPYSTCPTSASSTWWAWTRGRLPTGCSPPTSAAPQVGGLGWATFLAPVPTQHQAGLRGHSPGHWKQVAANPVTSGPQHMALSPASPWAPTSNAQAGDDTASLHGGPPGG